MLEELLPGDPLPGVHSQHPPEHIFTGLGDVVDVARELELLVLDVLDQVHDVLGHKRRPGEEHFVEDGTH